MQQPWLARMSRSRSLHLTGPKEGKLGLETSLRAELQIQARIRGRREVRIARNLNRQLVNRPAIHQVVSDRFEVGNQLLLIVELAGSQVSSCVLHGDH